MALPVSTTRLQALFCGAYVAGLALERLTTHPEVGLPFAWFATGTLSAAFTVLPRHHWPLPIAWSILATAIWSLLVDQNTGVTTLWIIGTTLATAGAVGGVTEFILPPQRRGALAQTVLPLQTLLTIGVGLTYAMATTLVQDSPLDPQQFGLSNGLAVGAGMLAGAVPLVLLGLPERRRIQYSRMRVLLGLIATLIATVGSTVAVAKLPGQWLQALHPFEYTWRTIAATGAFMMTLLLGPVEISLFFCALTIWCGWAIAHLNPGAEASEALIDLVAGQGLLVGIMVLTLMCMSLVNARRRAGRLQHALDRIAGAMLAAHAHIPRHVRNARLPDVERALGYAGDYCGADACALYRTEDGQARSQRLLFYQVWIGNPERTPVTRFRPVVVLDQFPGLAESLGQGSLRYLPATNLARHGMDAAFVEDHQLQVSLMPIVFDGVLRGALVMVGHLGARVRDKDANAVLGTLGNHYLGYDNHARAVQSTFGYEQRLRELSARFSDAEERVRRETSVELHDSLVQRLAVARMKLGELSRRRVSAPETVETITAIVDDALGATREIIRALSISVLYELGLVPGLQEYLQKFERTSDIKVSLEESGDRMNLSEPLRVTFFTAIRELVENSVIHANGANVWVGIQWDTAQGVSSIEVADDGQHQGWWLGKDRRKGLGLGLTGVAEQLERFGYDLRFDFRPGGGTRAVIIYTGD